MRDVVCDVMLDRELVAMWECACGWQDSTASTRHCPRK